MFRAMRRPHQALTPEESIEILKKERRGVLSVIGDDGYPYGTPINHYYNEEDGKIYFHGGKIGHRVDAMKACPKVSFCVYDAGTPAEEGWWLKVRSVIVFGHIEMIEDTEEIFRIARKLSYKFTNDDDYIENEIVKSGPGTLMYALVPEHMTGKLVNER